VKTLFKVFIIVLSLCLLCSFLYGCKNNVKGYTKFYILGLENFFKLEFEEEREEYLCTKDLEFTEVGDIKIIPFIKENSESECVLLLHAYSKGTKKSIEIEKIEIISTSNEEICSVNPEKLVDTIDVWSDNMNAICTFMTDESWNFGGNELKLNVDVRLKQGDKTISRNLSFNILLETYSGPSWQV